ncbi:malonate decarboxylase holo-ACP synthase [Cupriavidus numazuensis]|uniref:Phosphoribosyl-dephospho-CoA transferase n=1 Tax=Cupriavidus numazuensis TaxID=221992 RepID=A0ABN7Q8I6_9BURK|nr:malonate decarboxylase holo-ACP synthase [Cupriavidus numazuensis]CAG2157344.1 Phosphoribosyl-dephospho-CoA transferase [Cupriavidus numazuensis]
MASLNVCRPAPHDLLWLADARRALCGVVLPDWVSLAALDTIPVVVRRDARRTGAIAIGLRGRSREERFGTWVSPVDVARVVTPMDIAASRAWRHPELAALAAIRTLDAVADALDARNIRWGVGGSAGFTLASGINVLHAQSDLDLLVYADHSLSLANADLLAALQDAGPARIDIQVDTPQGGFSFLEWRRTRGKVLLKTAHGPRMCADPWRATP